MTKKELIAVAERYGMDWFAHPITRQKLGVWCTTHEAIPELDSLVDGQRHSVFVERTFNPIDPAETTYKVFCPSSWLDLYGWVE